MLQIANQFVLLLVSALLILRSQAFQHVSSGRAFWAISKDNFKQWNDGEDIAFSSSNCRRRIISLYESSTGSDDVTIDQKRDDEATKDTQNEDGTTATTNTINERLMAELREAEETEKFGSKGKKMSLVDGYGRPRKSDAEIKAAIAEARDLNGVNPLVAITGSFFAFGVAAALWAGTNQLGGYFASHPPDSEVYFVLRTAQVFRNVVMGMISLASGFFGVTGLGIFGMGVRVAYGVMTGELDPTPIKRSTQTKKTVDVGNMIDLMMNKKPGRGRK